MATAPTRFQLRPPSNRRIATELLARFTPLITAVALKMGVSYSLANEDREDLIGYVKMKILAVDWRRLGEQSGQTDFQLYCKALILNSMRKEIRRIQRHGYRGFSDHIPLNDIPQPIDPQPGSGIPSCDGLERRTMGTEVFEKAQAVLDPMELMVIELMFGFDGGGERTVAQIAEELEMPRLDVMHLSMHAIWKLRRHMKIRAVSFS